MLLRGGHPLRGEVSIRGAKNSLPKIMVASLLTPEPCTLRNVAGIVDVAIVSDLIRRLGGEVNELEPGVIQISTEGLRPMERSVLKEFSGKSRIPILTCGPLLARFGDAPGFSWETFVMVGASNQIMTTIRAAVGVLVLLEFIQEHAGGLVLEDPTGLWVNRNLLTMVANIHEYIPAEHNVVADVLGALAPIQIKWNGGSIRQLYDLLIAKTGL